MAVLVTVSPAVGAVVDDGILLSSADYVYLAAQDIQRNNVVLQKMSPKELRRLHSLINDDRTQNDPQSRAKAVMGALAGFETNQQWEIANPGRLWDVEKLLVPAGSNRH